MYRQFQMQRKAWLNVFRPLPMERRADLNDRYQKV
jgi:hypothetical protein